MNIWMYVCLGVDIRMCVRVGLYTYIFIYNNEYMDVCMYRRRYSCVCTCGLVHLYIFYILYFLFIISIIIIFNLCRFSVAFDRSIYEIVIMLYIFHNMVTMLFAVRCMYVLCLYIGSVDGGDSLWFDIIYYNG